MKSFFFFVLIFICSNVHAYDSKVAIVKSRYDKIESVISSLRIKYDLLEYRDLENMEIFRKYSMIFFPCGMEYPLETTINVQARRTNIQSVTLNDEYHDVNKTVVADNIKEYIKNGGSAYFSDYSFDHLNRAFGMMNFFDRFPYMGLSERIDLELKGDLRSFLSRDKVQVSFNHTGWIAIQRVSGAEILASAKFETARGEKSGPLAFASFLGEGQAMYITPHENELSAIKRFFIMRGISLDIIKKIHKTANLWDQEVLGTVSDFFNYGESARSYRFDVKSGTNYIYFSAEKGSYQIDVFDTDMNIIESRDIAGTEQMFRVASKKDGHVNFRVYPSVADRHSLFAAVCVSGIRLFPYFFNILIIIGSISAFVLFLYGFRLMGFRRFGGKPQL